MNKHLLVPLVAVGLLAAACGSSSKPAANGSSSTTAGNVATGDINQIVKSDPLSGAVGSGLTRGVTASSVKIGCVIDAKSFAGFEDGAKARFDRENAAGGVNGRKIDFLGCNDDTANPQQDVSLHKQVVEQDGAFGLLTSEPVTPQAAFDYLNQHQVPYTGWGFLPGFCGTRWGFGYSGCLVGDTATQAVPHAVADMSIVSSVIQAAGMKGSDVRLAVQNQDTEVAKIAETLYKTVWQHAGAKIVYLGHNLPSPGPTSDYTPFVRYADEIVGRLDAIVPAAEPALAR